MTQLPAVSHVALTVTDLARSVPWYERLLGTKPVLDENTNGFHHTVYLLPGGTLLALHQHPATGGGDRFDEHRPGLDHLSFGVADRDELKAWQARLEELGIPHLGISRMLPATRVSSLTTEQTGRSIRNGNGNLRRHQDP